MRQSLLNILRRYTNDFQIAIRGIIGGGIATLRQDHEAEIAAQATTRATEEEGIVRQTGWRGEVDLPQEQLAPMDPMDPK